MNAGSQHVLYIRRGGATRAWDGLYCSDREGKEQKAYMLHLKVVCAPGTCHFHLMQNTSVKFESVLIHAVIAGASYHSVRKKLNWKITPSALTVLSLHFTFLSNYKLSSHAAGL